MPKVAKVLSAIEVQRLTKMPPDTRPFNYFAVGGVSGLLLRVSQSGACYWILRYSAGKRATSTGKEAPARHDLGLGAYPEVSLKEARERATKHREQIREGVDPVERRREARRARQDRHNKHMTFADAVTLAKELDGIGDDKGGKAWQYRLDTYAIPALGALPVAQITRGDLVNALAPIWSTKTRTAKEVRRLIENVIDRAYASRNIDRNNPARWDKSLALLLPAQTAAAGNFASLPYTLVNAFLNRLRGVDQPEAKAVEYIVYTATRSGEVCGATWAEIDFDRKLWTVPAERMKKGEEHRVHLSKPALALLRSLPGGELTDPIFPSKTGKHPRDARLSSVARGIGEDLGFKATVHGFRATFRTWGEEETDYPEPILEMALAHKIDDAVKAAYQRGDLLKKRRALLDDWASYCEKPGPEGEVVSMKGVERNDEKTA